MLDKKNAVLVVIDVQGRLATLMHENQELFTNIIRMIRGARVLNIPIIWTEQIPDKLGGTIAEIKDELDGVDLLTKSTFSCCGDRNFNEKLNRLGRKQIIVTGIEAHICVYQTCIDLLGSNFEVHLVTDAVSSRLESNYHLGVQRIKEVGAVLTSVEMSLFEMLKVAEGEQFKGIIQIVK